jgi:hypothetical protein
MTWLPAGAAQWAMACRVRPRGWPGSEGKSLRHKSIFLMPGVEMKAQQKETAAAPSTPNEGRQVRRHH